MQKSHGIPQHQCSCQTYGHHCTCGERSNDGLLTRAASGAANPLLPAGQSYPRRALTTQESSHTGMVYDSIATPPSQLPLNSVAHTPSTSFGPILEQHVYQLDGSSPTSPSSPNGRRASTSARSANRSRDPLDPSYAQRDRDFFKRYRVFIVSWPEIAGIPRASGSFNSESSISRDMRGEGVFTKPRRMIILGTTLTHCLCVPIQTYRGQGVAKERLIARHHAIVHTGAACPPPLDKEIEFGKGSLMKPSVRVVPDSPTEKLDPESRISYSEVYTVHLSVKVKCFGMIHPGSHDVLRYSYQAVQEDVISSEFGRDAKAVAVLVDR